MPREEMMVGRSDDPEHPARITGVATPRTCLGLDRGTHLGQRHRPRKQAGHMTAHRTVVNSSPVTPCIPGPSTHDPGIPQTRTVAASLRRWPGHARPDRFQKPTLLRDSRHPVRANCTPKVHRICTLGKAQEGPVMSSAVLAGATSY